MKNKATIAMHLSKGYKCPPWDLKPSSADQKQPIRIPSQTAVLHVKWFNFYSLHDCTAFSPWTVALWTLPLTSKAEYFFSFPILTFIGANFAVGCLQNQIIKLTPLAPYFAPLPPHHLLLTSHFHHRLHPHRHHHHHHQIRRPDEGLLPSVGTLGKWAK